MMTLEVEHEYSREDQERRDEAEAYLGTPRLGARHWAQVEGWGMAVSAMSYLFRPTDTEGVREVFELARRQGVTVALRGGGRSYGDASINRAGIVLDLTAMDRILDWNPETGIVEVEPGVNIRKLWQHIIADGWWPPVVSGTMYTTMAGCAAMNVHGKNNYRLGTFGEHILEFDLLTPKGELLTCSPRENSDLYHGAISGFGMLGCMIRLRIQMKKVHSGLLWVEAFNTKSIGEMIDEIDKRAGDADYLVGWIDCTARGKALGRGIIHAAWYRPEGEDRRPADHFNVKAQELPDRILGVFPKSLMWIFLKPFISNWGMRCVNLAKYYAGFLQPQHARYLQSHAGFHFLLDYVPNWKLAYRPGGLIQYQSFVPKDKAEETFTRLIQMAQEAGIPPYLGVFKKHRPDPFLLTHAVDGYSLALDFPVTKRNRKALWKLCARMDDVVLEGGGRFYFAKDATLRPEVVQRFFPDDNVQKFLKLKHQCDPDNVLQTNLSRRLFGEAFEDAFGGAGPSE
ncbi:MAG: FAD-binding oxidoreductase [Sumerlaeia bacterium]